MLAWLNEYAKHQVLFRRRDIVSLRKALATIPEDQLARWAADSEPLRERLFDDTWPQTQQWLHDFLAVQAIYSADEIDALRDRLATLTPSQLFRVLDHFQTIHLMRLRSREASERLRTQALYTSERLRPRQTSLRAASFSGRDAFSSSAGERRAPRHILAVRRNSLSQRISNYYINRAIWGRGFWLFWP